MRKWLRTTTLIAIAGSCYNTMPKLTELISQHQLEITNLTSSQTYDYIYSLGSTLVPLAMGILAYPFLKRKNHKQKTL